MAKILKHNELKVFQLSFESGMEVFRLTKSFPTEERYSLIDQIRRSSRSVSGNIAEGWRKRRYSKAFIAKLSDADGEAAETQVWLAYALACGYISPNQYETLYAHYDHIQGMLITMIKNSEKWTL
jgi:four helix bundle protein